MAGTGPAIHAMSGTRHRKVVDPRVKPGDDGAPLVEPHVPPRALSDCSTSPDGSPSAGMPTLT